MLQKPLAIRESSGNCIPGILEKILKTREDTMIRKAIVVSFALYLGASMSVFGGVLHTHFGSHTRAHSHNLNSRHGQVRQRQFRRHQQFHPQSFHLHESPRFPHALGHSVQFFQHRPHTVPSGFTAVKIPGQWVKFRSSSTWFEEVWVTIQSDENSTSTTELAPVWVEGEWMKNRDGSIWVPGHWTLTGQ